MNKSIYALALALVMGTTGALASNGDRNNNNCNGRDSCSEQGGGPVDVQQGQQQGQVQGQAQGQSQESYNANTNDNSNYNKAVSGSYSGSASNSSATGIGVGGSSTVGVAVKTGPTSSRSVSNAQGGQGGDGGDANATAYGGAGGDSYSGAYSEGSNAGASVGDVTSSSGPSNSEAYSGGNSQSISVRGDTVTYEDSASRAATVYSQVCQNGGSAQAKAGGFAIQNQDVVCEHLKVAAVMREAYMWEMAHGSAQCQEPMEMQHEYGGAEYADTCMSEKAVFYYKAYNEHMTEALQAMEMYEEVGLLDKISGALVRPMALIGALIWLI